MSLSKIGVEFAETIFKIEVVYLSGVLDILSWLLSTAEMQFFFCSTLMLKDYVFGE